MFANGSDLDTSALGSHSVTVTGTETTVYGNSTDPSIGHGNVVVYTKR